MAITEDKNSGTTPITDGTTYDPSTLGTDAGVISFMMYRDSVSTGTSSDFQLNSVNYTQDIALITSPLLSFDMYVTAGTIVSGSIPASGTHDAQLSSVATGEGGIVATLAGMLQSGTIVDDMQLVTFASAAMSSLTYNITSGDILYMMYESNGGTLTAPTTASSGDSYVEIASGALTGSPLTQGKIYKLIATSDMTSESEGNWLSGSNSGSLALCVIKAAAGGATGRIMSSLANHGGLAGLGGIAGKGGGLAG